MKARHCNPRPKLTDAVTCLHQFVIRHVEQITQLRLLQLVHNTSGRIPKRCPRHAAAQRNAAHPQHALSAVRVIADRGALRPCSQATSASERDLVNA
jgi:hypothetical protein